MTNNDRPKAVCVTIGHGGWSAKLPPSDDPFGGGNLSGYGDRWQDHVGPGTVVIDLTAGDWNQLVSLTMSGPMLDADLPDGTVDPTSGVVTAYPSNDTSPWGAGGFDMVALNVYASMAESIGATVTGAFTRVPVPSPAERQARVERARQARQQRKPRPSMEDVLQSLLPDGWSGDMDILECPCGHLVEHDGACPNGCVSPVRSMGLI
jgi:hypothetical protein